MHISELRENNQYKIAILWYGKEGKSVLHFLESLSYPVDNITLIDTENISSDTYQTITWSGYVDHLEQYDIIFKSPGISPYHPQLIEHRDKFSSGTELFFDNYQWKVIWITATKGKSTISTLTYQCLKDAWYNVKLVWNIGTPVLDEIDILNWEVYDYVIYELSSYMLEGFQPKLEIALLWNIYPDHLDWHENMENYKKAKNNILFHAKNKYLHGEREEKIKKHDVQTYWTSWIFQHKQQCIYKNNDLFLSTSDIMLLWIHNYMNICWVLSILSDIWVNEQSIKNTIGKFQWLSHRMENIWTYKGITFIDDAISTTPESTIAAIETFWDQIDTLFLGGTDRGYDFKKLWECIGKYNVQNIVLFPISWEKIEAHLPQNSRIFKTDNMAQAITFAYKQTSSWKICLLSTASPSYSIWENYQEKWKLFKQEIQKQAS